MTAHKDTIAAAKADVAASEAKAKLAEPTLADKLAELKAKQQAALDADDMALLSKLSGEASKLKAKAEADELQAKRDMLADAERRLTLAIRELVEQQLSSDELGLADGVWFSWDMSKSLNDLTVRMLRATAKPTTAKALGERVVAGANGPPTSKLLAAYGEQISSYNELELSYNELKAQAPQLATSKVGNFVHFKIREPLLAIWNEDGQPSLS